MIVFRLFYAVIMFILEQIAPLFSSKLRQRQRAWRDTVRKADLIIKRQNKPVVWFHAASAGEFEQAKPIIEYLAKSNVPITIIVSFFSPSGYKMHQTYPFVSAVTYIPLDSFFSVRFFLRSIKPSIAIIIRYELWYELYRQISKAKIPLFLISATFPAKRLPTFFFKDILQAVTALYAANSDSAEKFRPFISSQTELINASDTRFDQILSVVLKTQRSEEKLLPKDFFSSEDIVIVAGSSWHQDEILLSAILRNNNFSLLKLIIVPHEITNSHLDSIEKLFPNTVKLSKLTSKHKRCNIIVDCYGKLLQLYDFADIAYIGGGFGAGVHSVAEPAGYGIPLICGPKINRSPDAIELHKRGGLRVVSNEKELTEALNLLISSKDSRSEAGLIAHQYIESGKGISRIIGDDIIARL